MLTKLCIINALYYCEIGNLFEVLINLTDLELSLIGRELCDMLANANCRLLRFSGRILTHFLEPGVWELMILVPSFRQLQHLTLNYDAGIVSRKEYFGSNQDMEICAELVKMITRDLRSLHTLELDMGMNISFCPSFAHLANLKCIRWALQRNRFEEQSEEASTRWEDLRHRAIGEFNRAFANFKEKPRLLIEFNSWYYEKFYGRRLGYY
jgi:hypothetical protein